MTSLLFSVAHFSSYSKLLTFISIFISGILYNIVFEKTGSIYGSIAVHATENIFIIIVDYKYMGKFISDNNNIQTFLFDLIPIVIIIIFISIIMKKMKRKTMIVRK